MINKKMVGELAVCMAFPVSLFASLLICAAVWG